MSQRITVITAWIGFGRALEEDFHNVHKNIVQISILKQIFIRPKNGDFFIFQSYSQRLFIGLNITITKYNKEKYQ